MWSPADTIDCANPVNWACPLNRGLIGDYSYVPTLYFRSRLANSAGDSGLVYDLSKLPCGLGREMNSTGVSGNGVMYGLHAGIIGGSWRGPNRPGGFGKTWDNTGGICSWTLGQSDASNVQGRMSKYVFAMTVPFSIFAWINLNGIAVDQGVMANILGGVGGNDSVGWQFSVKDRPKLRFVNTRTGFERSGVASAASITAGKWYHVGVTYDGSNAVAGIAFYVNAIKQTTTTSSDTGDPSPLAGTRPFIWTGDGGLTLVGYGDQCRIYNRVVPAMEVRQLYVESLLGSPNLYRRITPFDLSQLAPGFLSAIGYSASAASTRANLVAGIINANAASESAVSSKGTVSVSPAALAGGSAATERSFVRPFTVKSATGSSQAVDRDAARARDLSATRGLSAAIAQDSELHANSLALTVGMSRVADWDSAGPLSATIQIASGISEAADRSSGRDMVLASSRGRSSAVDWDKAVTASFVRPTVLSRDVAESLAHETMVAQGHGDSIATAVDRQPTRAIVPAMAREFSTANDWGHQISLPQAVALDRSTAWAESQPINTGYLHGLSEVAERDRGRGSITAGLHAASFAFDESMRLRAVTSRLWSPSDLGTSLVAWYKADTLVANDGDLVSTWNDLSGNGFTLGMPFPSNRPTYKAAIVNGLPVVRFTDDAPGFANPKALQNAAGISPNVLVLSQPCLIAVIANLGVPPGQFTLIGSFSGNPFVFGGTTFGSPTNYVWNMNAFDPINGFHGPTYFPGTDWSGPLGGWRLHEAVANNANSEVRRDGTLLAGDLLSNSGFNGIQLGSFLNADVLEIIIAADVSSTTRQLIEGYADWRAGIQANLPGGHPYQNAAPTLTINAPSILAMPTVNERSAAYDRAKEQVTVAAMHGGSFTIVVCWQFTPALSISATAIVKIGQAAECRVNIGRAATSPIMISAGGKHRTRVN